MLRLWPLPSTELDQDQLAAYYAYPAGLAEPWVRVNFVASADGAATVSGVSGGLSLPPDRRVFGLLRQLADVVLVGAGTARAENYGGARKPRRGADTPPRIAVVTASADLDPTARLFTDTLVPPLILAAGGAKEDKLRRLAEAGAEVVVLDGPRVTPAGLLGELAARGLYRVLCEGGPALFGELIAADVVDELCLTVSPILAGGAASRIAHGLHQRADQLRRLELGGLLIEDDVLLLRYRRARLTGSSPGE